MRARVYHLPDTLCSWPWQPQTNPHYRAAQAESVAWLESFRPFTTDTQSAFNGYDFSLLTSMAFPQMTFEKLRGGCDLMHTFFALDDYTDELNGAGVKALCDIAMDAIDNPDQVRPEVDYVIGEIARQIWKRVSHNAPKGSRKRFVTTWRTHLDSVVQQAERRAKGYVCTLEEYIDARRDNIGTSPTFTFMEMALGLDLPREVAQHPAVVSL
ncbi:isoprenoid synthase domain-containing protein, partial [Mycena pura]